MDNDRKVRYLQKCRIALEKLRGIPIAPKTDLDTDACLFRVQVSVDAAMDLAAMLVKDLGGEPSDDYHNVDKLEEMKLIPKPLGEQLRLSNGLRNAIVHKYNSFEIELALKRVPLTKKAIGNFIGIVEAKLNEL